WTRSREHWQTQTKAGLLRPDRFRRGVRPLASGRHFPPPASAVSFGLVPMEAVTRLNSALTGRYEIDREIGVGGMATVYLARALRHHRNVALKVLDPELGAQIGPERFLAEIRVTANLQHPNILPLFDSGEAHDADGSGGTRSLFYVMPYVDGESLRARL